MTKRQLYAGHCPKRSDLDQALVNAVNAGNGKRVLEISEKITKHIATCDICTPSLKKGDE